MSVFNMKFLEGREGSDKFSGRLPKKFEKPCLNVNFTRILKKIFIVKKIPGCRLPIRPRPLS
jgi:hypothetical protein